MVRSIIALVCLLLALIACTRQGLVPDSQTAVTRSNGPGASGGSATTLPLTPRETLILRDTDGQGKQNIALLDTTTGRLQARLPYGAFNKDQSLLYAASPSEDGAATTVQVLKLPKGEIVRSTTIKGPFKLTGETALSPDEHLLVLSRQTSPDRKSVV